MGMGKIAIAAAAVLMLAGCASQDAKMNSYVRPVGEDLYEVKLTYYVTAPADSPKYERVREGVVAEYISMNGYCPSGWTIADRTVTTRIDNMFGTAGDIFYKVQCKSA